MRCAQRDLSSRHSPRWWSCEAMYGLERGVDDYERQRDGWQRATYGLRHVLSSPSDGDDDCDKRMDLKVLV